MLHGIPEIRDEKTGGLCINTIKKHLELSIAEANIEHVHRIGKPRDASQKLRHIIVNFVKYNDRKNVFNRKKPKRKEYCNYGEFNTQMKKVKRGRRWDGKILFKEGSGSTRLFYD